MKKYIVTEAITLLDGVVALSKQQASMRLRSLKKVKNGVYQVISEIQFKAGEEISFDSDPKALLGSLIDVAKAAKAEKEAEAKAAEATKNKGE